MSMYDKVFRYLSESWISFKEDEITTDDIVDNLNKQGINTIKNPTSDNSNSNADADANANSDNTQDNKDNKDNNNQKVPQPNLDWKIILNSAILYNGDKNNPNAMVWIFANQVNVGYKEEWLDKINKDQDKNNDKNSILKPNIKDDLKRLAAVATVGGVVTQGIKNTTNLLDPDSEKQKTAKKTKNSKGEEDKIASLFENIDSYDISIFKDSEKLEKSFKKQALYELRIPEDLLNQYIEKVLSLMKDKEKQDAKAASAAKKQAKSKMK